MSRVGVTEEIASPGADRTAAIIHPYTSPTSTIVSSTPTTSKVKYPEASIHAVSFVLSKRITGDI
jgi:hypothetical protein